MQSPAPTPTRHHRTRLMQIWRSAGWPCRDGLEIDLLAWGFVRAHPTADGLETLHLTQEGIQLLAAARRQAVRAQSQHDRLSAKFVAQLHAAGRIVWRELSLRAEVSGAASRVTNGATHGETSSDLPSPAYSAEMAAASRVLAPAGAMTSPTSLWPDEETAESRAAANVWRGARPDLFSVRNTTVPAYLQPMVHEVKFSRADLLSDLRHGAKRHAYQWLCEECYYVFPAGIAQADEIPQPWGIWVLHGDIETGHFELIRPARHASCTLPFAVWLALCKATPVRRDETAEPAQADLAGDHALPEGSHRHHTDPEPTSCCPHTTAASDLINPVAAADPAVAPPDLAMPPLVPKPTPVPGRRKRGSAATAANAATAAR